MQINQEVKTGNMMGFIEKINKDETVFSFRNYGGSQGYAYRQKDGKYITEANSPLVEGRTIEVIILNTLKPEWY